MDDDTILEAYRRLGSKRAAARELGIPRSTLQGRLRAIEPHLDGASDALGFDRNDVSEYWVKTKGGSYRVKRDTSVNYDDLRERFLKDVELYAPKYEKIKYRGGDRLLVVDAADVHFGKLAEVMETGYTYDLAVAEKRLKQGVASIAARADLFGIDQIVYVTGNDWLHVDSPHGTTTSGTRQDATGMWWQSYETAKRANISVIETLTQIAPVRLVHCPSNHDFASGWMLADSIASWFRNNPNVILTDSSLSIAHRKYLQFGDNLLGFTHGDGAKETDLPSIMQFEARQEWASSRFAFWFLHHWHHKDAKVYGKAKGAKLIEKDHAGVTVLRNGLGRDPVNNVFTEVIRSPSPPDAWHHRNGYLNMQAIEGVTFHAEEGMKERFTEWF